MLLCYMQTYHDTCRYQECAPTAEKYFLKLPMTESGIQQYTNIALKKEGDKRKTTSVGEAQILLAFFKFLGEMPDGAKQFNVPRGAVEKIPPEKIKFFLDTKRTRHSLYFEALDKKGWNMLPFFVVDPFDRQSFPSIEADLCKDPKDLSESESLAKFKRKIRQSILELDLTL